MGKLALYLPDGTIHEIPLDKERITIGRRADNDICLPYPAVSGEHASVVTILADSFLEDQGSTNGTLVNGKPIVKHFLRDQDAIDIGRQRLVYLANDEDVVEPLTADQLKRGLRELDEQVARVRASRSRVPPAPRAAQRLAGAGGSEASSSDPVPEVIPSNSAEDDLARDMGEALVASDSREPPPASPPAEEHIGFGDRSNELAQLIAARQNWIPKSERASAADTVTEDEPQGVVRRRVSTVVESETEQPSVGGPRLVVVKGPNSGRELALAKDLITIGRVGLQVAQIRRVRDGWELIAVEGTQPATVNGVAVTRAVPLKSGDIIAIAGNALTLVGA
jgi:pSer/pThr/pTyr-binding forkhead associated (FHA) protein